MRRFGGLLVLVALCVSAAGCGGGGHKSVSPLDDALGYFAKDAPLVAAIETDPATAQVKQLRSYITSVGTGYLSVRLQNLVRLRYLDFARDIKPQIGAPLVIGLARPAASTGAAAKVLVAAIRIKHPLQAKQVLLRQPNVRGSSKSSGVRIYEDPLDKRWFAVDGPDFVFATDRAILEHALALKRTDGRMRESDFDADLKQLPSGGLVRVSAEPRQLIAASARLRPALAVKWIGSLGRLGAVLRGDGGGMALDFRLATDRREVTDSDLPLAPKPSRLGIFGRAGELQVALREPARLARLVFAAWRAIAPRAAARFRRIEPASVDLERQLPRHLAETAQVAYDPIGHGVAIRADLRDPADVRASLAPLARVLPELAANFGVKGAGVAAPAPGENFYALARTDGSALVFGVVGKEFVAAADPPRAARLATAKLHSPPHGASGSAVFTADARRLAQEFLAQHLRGAARILAPIAVGGLRDLTGALTINRSALTGHVKLTVAK